jgi:hypothetical protein
MVLRIGEDQQTFSRLRIRTLACQHLPPRLA